MSDGCSLESIPSEGLESTSATPTESPSEGSSAGRYANVPTSIPCLHSHDHLPTITYPCPRTHAHVSTTTTALSVVVASRVLLPHRTYEHAVASPTARRNPLGQHRALSHTTSLRESSDDRSESGRPNRAGRPKREGRQNLKVRPPPLEVGGSATEEEVSAAVGAARYM